MKLNNINLKKVLPVALTTLTVLLVTIYFVACGNKNNGTEDKTTKVANKTTEEQTTGSDVAENETTRHNSNGSGFLGILGRNDKDDPDNTEPQTTLVAGEQQTTGNGEKQTTSKKPVKDEKETTSISSNIIDYNANWKPTYQQTTGNNTQSGEQQTTGNDVVEVGYGLYETVEKEIYNTEEDKYYRTTEYYAWYEKYADGTIKMDDNKDNMLPQYIDGIDYSSANYGDYIMVSLEITDYYSYKYFGKFSGMRGDKSKELYNKYYKSEYAKVTIDENDYYHIDCLYYIDTKTNKTYGSYEEIQAVLTGYYKNDIINALGLNNSSMSREKKVYLLSDYIDKNWDSLEKKIKNSSEDQFVVSVLNDIGINAYLTQEKDNGPIIKLIQMEDGLWYNLYWDYNVIITGGRKELDLGYVENSSLENYPNGAVFATPQTSNLVFRDIYPNDTGYYTIPFTSITY